MKIHKSLGLGIRHKDGRLLPVDDPKLDPLWATCGKHGKPVMIHTADPAAFFTPLDSNNERWHELNEHPQWLFFGKDFPAREDLLAQYLHVVGQSSAIDVHRHHFGNNAEDLAAVGKSLDEHPNLYVDIDARISELGRAPYSARKFFIKYQDRIMFGTDTPPRRDAFRIYYRFLETDDEYFDCAASHHLQGFWRIYGLFLPDEVLEKIYAKNAERSAARRPGGRRPLVLTSLALMNLSPTSSLLSSLALTSLASLNLPQHPQQRCPLCECHGRQISPFVATAARRSGTKPAGSLWQSAAAGGADYQTRLKVLYSETGLYVLMDGADKKLTATMTEDFLDLWNEDVFEFFVWPDERQTIYFEYEISPLGIELPILVPNINGTFLGWRPWHYEGARKIQKATSISGGPKKSGAQVTGWCAEVFMPFALLEPLANVPPKPGTRWRANFYRMDYDEGRTTSWDWARVGPSFHEFQKFGTLEFGE